MDFNFGFIFLFQTVIGILGNFSLLCHYTFLCFSGYRSRSTDVFLWHLTVANSLVIVPRGVLETMGTFGMKGFITDLGCKVVFYAHRVGRGVSMDSICLLSVFQAIAISPRDSIWAVLKGTALRYMGPSNILCWVLHMLLNYRVSMLVTKKRNSTHLRSVDFQYCSALLPENNTRVVFDSWMLSHDVFCLKLMVWTSGFMAFLLLKHKKQVRHIHRHSATPSSDPVARASHNILILASTFVSLYAFSSAIGTCCTIYNTVLWLANSSALISSCFPTACPFILMSRESKMSLLVWKK